jgi:hypothetical protein
VGHRRPPQPHPWVRRWPRITATGMKPATLMEEVKEAKSQLLAVLADGVYS